MKVEFHKQAEKFILRLPEKQQKRIIKAAYKLPRGDVAALKSRPGKFRLRVGNFRAVFEYRKDVIFILEIDNRGDVYK